jgi:hypothetical protein
MATSRYLIYGDSQVLRTVPTGVLVDHRYGDLHWYYEAPDPARGYAVPSVRTLPCDRCYGTYKVELVGDDPALDPPFVIRHRACDAPDAQLLYAASAGDRAGVLAALSADPPTRARQLRAKDLAGKTAMNRALAAGHVSLVPLLR